MSESLSLQVAEEKKAEAKRRGNKDTQTSDARFDAGFSFANAMGGKASHVCPPSLPEMLAAHACTGQSAWFACASHFFGLGSDLPIALHATHRRLDMK